MIDNTEIEKRKFHNQYIVIGILLITYWYQAWFLLVEKFFVGYKDDDYKTKSLCIKLPKTSAYDGKIKWMSFLIKSDNLLKKYNDIWNKVTNSIKKNLIANLSTIKRKLKTKTRYYVDEPTDFHFRKISEAGPNYIC